MKKDLMKKYYRVYDSKAEALKEYEVIFTVSDIVFNVFKKNETDEDLTEENLKKIKNLKKIISEYKVGKIVKGKNGNYRTDPKFKYGSDWILVLPWHTFYTKRALQKIKDYFK